jgi:Tol biopolymer transport system component
MVAGGSNWHVATPRVGRSGAACPASARDRGSVGRVKHDWSPDGTRIALTTQANPEPGKSANLVTIRPDGTGLRRLTRFTNGRRSAFAGSFSPDGTQIVFRLERGARSSLAVIDERGGRPRLLTTGKGKPRFIDWGTHP